MKNIFFVSIVVSLFSHGVVFAENSCTSGICGNGESCSQSGTGCVFCTCYQPPEGGPTRQYCSAGIAMTNGEVPRVDGYTFVPIDARAYRIDQR